MGFFDWLFGRKTSGSPQSTQSRKSKSASTVICLCEKCGEEYRLGDDALVMTWEEAERVYRSRGSGFSVGSLAGTPDTVQRVENAGGQSLPEELRSKEKRLRRKWTCPKCKTTQSYSS